MEFHPQDLGESQNPAAGSWGRGTGESPARRSRTCGLSSSSFSKISVPAAPPPVRKGNAKTLDVRGDAEGWEPRRPRPGAQRGGARRCRPAQPGVLFKHHLPAPLLLTGADLRTAKHSPPIAEVQQPIGVCFPLLDSRPGRASPGRSFKR